MTRPLGARFLGAAATVVVALVAALAAFLATRDIALAHNVGAAASYNCAGGWSYSASYLNGGGGGPTDNRLVVVDVAIGGTTIKEYHYFDTLTSHPAAPAGFTVIDHPTVTSFTLFSLSGTTSPITASGSIKVYDGGPQSQPSSDPIYDRYLPQYSLNPIPQPSPATGCPSTSTNTPTPTATHTATATPTPTNTPTPTSTATSTSTPTPTNTPTPTATSLPSFSGLDLVADKSSVPAGIAAVPLVDIPLSALSGGNSPTAAKLSSIKLSSILLDSIKLSSIKLSSIKLSSIQFESIQLSSIPIDTPGGWEAVLAGTPLQGVPLQNVKFSDVLELDPPPAALDPSNPQALSLADVDLGATSLGSLNLAAVSLGPTKLSSIAPPAPAVDWCDALAASGTTCAGLGYTPATIGDATLLDINVRGAKLSSIKLSSIKLSSIDLSAAGLASIKLSSIPVQDLKLSSIKLSSIPLETMTTGGLASTKLSSITLPDGAGSWCAYFTSQGYDCAALGITDDSALADVIAAFQAAGTQFADGPLASIKLSSIKLSSIDLAAVKLSSISLESLTVSGAKLSSIKLSSIDLATAKLSSIKLSSIPVAQLPGVVNCGLVDCSTATLGDAAAAGALLPNATLGQLGVYDDAAVADILLALGAQPADLAYFLSFFYGDQILGDVANGPVVNLDDLTLGDLLIAMLIRADYAWEDVPLDELTAADLPSTELITYTASFTSQGGSVPTTLVVTLPPGFFYQPGSSLLRVDATETPAEDPSVSGQQHAWTLPGVPTGSAVELEFQVRPGVGLGVRDASISLTADGFAGLSSSNLAPVTVTENFEPNGDPATAPIVEPDVLYLSHISSATDRDFFRLAAQATGARISGYLSHQAQDNDLALYPPEAEVLRPPTGAKLSSIPLEDAQPDIIASDPPPGVLQDIDLAPLPLGQLSDLRGQSNETVGALSLDDAGFYTLQVAGYNGAANDDPYILRVKVTPPPPLPECDPRAFAFPGQGVPGVLPATIPSNVNTLFLVSPSRLGNLYGAAAAADVMTALNSLAARADLGVRGAVLAVDGDSAVSTAFAAWDANPCSPVLANDAVAAINAVVDGYRPSLTGLENIVLVGADDALPFARVPDLTRVSNEKDYTADALQIAGNNGLVGSFVTSNILSDDPYGSFSPISYLNRDVFLPQVAIGRLVEDPAQIIAQVDQFQQFSGQLDPSTALTTGYDFLSDGAEDVAAAVDALVGAPNADRLINDAWTAGDLAAAFDEATPVPGLASINAHFDHYRLLPGAGNTSGDESDLYTSADIARLPADPFLFPGSIIFSMGCHSGLNVADVLAPGAVGDQAARLLDWPQAFADQGAAIYVANTGYGYGDTERVAYSEQLMSLFATNLAGDGTVGEALAAAKREYYTSLVNFQTYDEKVLAQTTFYGLPMFRLPAPAGPPLTGASTTALPPQPPFTTDPIGGFTGININLAPTFEPTTVADGTYYKIDGQAESVTGRPIQPVTGVDLPAHPDGLTARGIVVTDLESADETGFDPVFSKAGSDQSLPEQPSGGTFPTSIHELKSVATLAGLLQRANFMPAQYIPNSPDPATGTERLYTSITAFVTYSDSPDGTPPTILETHAANIEGVVAFTASVEDDIPDNVKRVLVLYKPESSGSWASLDLVKDAGSSRWTGAASLTGNVQYTVYAIDVAGNVALSTNKGEFHQTIAAPIPSGIAVTISGTQGDGGWFLDASANLVGPPGVEVLVKIDNGPAVPYTGPFPITGTGVHVITATGADGSTGGAIVALDTLAPVASFANPLDGATFTINQAVTADYTCLDAGSGVASCAGPVASGSPLDTSVPGLNTFTVNTLDVAGNAGSAQVSYTVECVTPDLDCDSVSDVADNCPLDANPAQLNSDDDFISLAAYGKPFNDVTWPNSDRAGNVCDSDDDNDGLADAAEAAPCPAASAPTSPVLRDTDGDFYLDGAECLLGSDPASASSVPAPPAVDADHDGLSDAVEATLGTLGDPDSDDDGVLDGIEVKFYGTNPKNPNTDADDCRDGKEVASINGDRAVNSIDILLLSQAYGSSTGPKYVPHFDLNRDGTINSGDQLLIAINYFPVGPCAP